ncbi:hypothetical protein BCY84_20150 [Trypanosoma cruzi cruzi]|nr:hypothetical protein BCY84_20150 [Trypanosoma cruzi cruzi]
MRVCSFSSNRGGTLAHVDGSGSPGDSHCGSTLFPRQQHRGARTRTQFVVGHCGVSRNGACGAKSEKASDLTQLTDRWITGMVALSKHIIRARQLRNETCCCSGAGDWDPRASTPPSLVGWRPHWHASAPGFCTNKDGCYGPCSPPSRTHAVGATRMPHSRHAMNLARKRLLLPLDPTPPRSDAGRLPGVRQALQLPRECRDARVQRPWHYALPGAVEVNSSWCAGAAGNSTGTTARHLSEDEGEGRHTDRTPPRNAEPRPRPFADRRCTTNEPGSELFSGTSTCSTAPEHEGGVPVNMTIRLHPPRSGARPVDSLPKRKREQHPIHAHTHAPEQSRSRHQGPQHSMDVLTATGGRAMPGQASHTRHNLSDGESVTTPKIEPQCTHAAKLETQREEGQARTATLSPRETPSSAQEANAGGGRRTVRPK